MRWKVSGIRWCTQHCGDGRELPSNRARTHSKQINYATERELALAGLSRHSELLRQIQAALCRIEARTFGVCQRCQTAIRRKRLIAIPWTPLCIQCQELADGHDSIDELRATAA